VGLLSLDVQFLKIVRVEEALGQDVVDVAELEPQRPQHSIKALHTL
jgi:hypothetical protein